MKCLTTLQKCEKTFGDFSERFSRETITKWESLDTTPRKDGNSVISVYQAQLKNGMLTFIYSLYIVDIVDIVSQDWHPPRRKLIKDLWKTHLGNVKWAQICREVFNL